MEKQVTRWVLNGLAIAEHLRKQLALTGVNMPIAVCAGYLSVLTSKTYTVVTKGSTPSHLLNKK